MSHAKTIQITSDGCPGPTSRGLAAIRKTRPARLLARVLLIGCAALVASGVGHVLANPARDESHQVADLVSRLAEGSHQIGTVPQSLESSLGYEPVASSGKLAKPTGGCSTPIPLGPEAFEEACRTHDLGYDLLRSAEENGHRLGVWARFELDRRLYLDLLSTCETLRCRTAAVTYYTAVTTNSIRQGYGVPTDEPAAPWVGIGLLVICFGILTDPRGGLRSTARRLNRAQTPVALTQGTAESEPTNEHPSSTDPVGRRDPSRLIEPSSLVAGSLIWRHRRYRRSTV